MTSDDAFASARALACASRSARAKVMTSDEEVARRAEPPTLAAVSSTLAEGSSTLVEGSSTLVEGSLSGGSSLKTGSAATSGVGDVVLSTCMQGGSAATSGVSQAGADRSDAGAHDGARAHGGAFLSEFRKRMFPKRGRPSRAESAHMDRSMP